MVHVYVVTHIASGRHYVGKTSKKNPWQRWEDHQWEAVHGKQSCRHFHRAIATYGAEGFQFQVIETFDTDAEAISVESWWIEFLRSTVPQYGFNLLKSWHGMSPETKEKLRLANLGKRHTAETKAKMSASRIGKKMGPHTAERRAAQSELVKQRIVSGTWVVPDCRGRKLSPETIAKLKARTISAETRAKISIAKMGRVTSEEAKQKMRAAAVGRKPSQETVEKMRQSLLRRYREQPRSAEHCAKISAAKRGKTPSAEARENMRAGQARRRAAEKSSS